MRRAEGPARAAYPPRVVPSPPLRQLGRTGLTVSALGVGLAALGRPGYINLGHDRDFPAGRSVEAMREATFEVLDLARAAGIRYLDAARSYGRAEEFLAAWIADRELPPGQVTIGSKWGYTYVADWHVEAAVHEVKDHSLATLRRQVAESTSLLGRHLDLLQIHSATLESGVLGNADVLDELARLRGEGVVRAIGMTLSGAAQAETLRAAWGVRRDGRPVFDTVQATFNVLERSAADALAEAHERGMGVLVKEALANGRLVRGVEAQALRPMADRLGVGTDAVALAFALAQPWVDIVLTGPATVGQLEQNLQSLAVVLDGDALAELDELRVDGATYWRERSALPWI